MAARAAIRSEFRSIWDDSDGRVGPGNTTVIHGMQRGIDAMADAEAIVSGVKGIVRIPAEWDYWRSRGQVRKAGTKRNAEMLETLHIDVCLAFPGPRSRGTWDMVRRCLKAGIPVVVHQVG